jgi:sugar/nucleoside kinase (ribokinase family)
MYDIITVGAATRDVFVKSAAFDVHEKDHSAGSFEGCFPLGAKIEIDDLVFETGGGATNAATTFSRLGYRTAIVTAVGGDEIGEEMIGVLRAERIDGKLVQKDPKNRTGYSIIILAESGERTVLVYRGASEHISAMRIAWPKVAAKWLYVSSLAGNIDLMERIIRHAQKKHMRIAWNPGAKEVRLGLHALAPLIRSVDLFNVNKEEAGVLLGTDPQNLAHLIKNLRSLPCRSAIITDGLAGAYATDGDDVWHSATIDVPRINVTGAGDAFGSGVVAGLMRKDDLRYALAVGTWNATGVVQKMGPKRGIIKTFPSSSAIKKVVITPWKG